MSYTIYPIILGEVVIHSKSRDEVFREMQKYRTVDTLSSIRYAGKLPEGVEATSLLMEK